MKVLRTGVLLIVMSVLLVIVGGAIGGRCVPVALNRLLASNCLVYIR
jgi:hypothetical protein